MLLHFVNSLYFKAADTVFGQEPFSTHWAMFQFLLAILTENVSVDTLEHRRQNLVQANWALVVQVGDELCCHSDGFMCLRKM